LSANWVHSDSADGVFDRYFLVDTVLKIKIDNVDVEPLQAGFAGFADVFGPSVCTALGIPSVNVAKLGREDDLVATVSNGLTDKCLIRPAAVSVCGIDEADTAIGGGVYGGDGLRFVRGAVNAGHGHAAEADFRCFNIAISKFPGFHGGPSF